MNCWDNTIGAAPQKKWSGSFCFTWNNCVLFKGKQR